MVNELKKNEVNVDKRDIIKAILISAVISVAIMLALGVIQALISNFADISSGASRVLSYIAWGAASVLGGYIAARAAGNRGLIIGAIEGIVIFLLCLLMGVLSTSKVSSFSAIWPNLVISLLFSGIGGVLGVNLIK